jgi:hypothetical protein
MRLFICYTHWWIPAIIIADSFFLYFSSGTFAFWPSWAFFFFYQSFLSLSLVAAKKHTDGEVNLNRKHLTVLCEQFYKTVFCHTDIQKKNVCFLSSTMIRTRAITIRTSPISRHIRILVLFPLCHYIERRIVSRMAMSILIYTFIFFFFFTRRLDNNNNNNNDTLDSHS